MLETHLNLIGNVASDIRSGVSNRSGTEGVPYATFRAASTSRKFDKRQGTWVDGETVYATVVCFRRLAEHVTSSVKKGDPILVLGTMRLRSWQADNNKGTELEIVAQAVGHNLVFGTSMFSKSFSWTPSESASSDLTSQSAANDSRGVETAAALATVSPLPGADHGANIRSVGSAVDASGVVSSRPREVGNAPHPGPSQPSPTADEQAA